MGPGAVRCCGAGVGERVAGSQPGPAVPSGALGLRSGTGNLCPGGASRGGCPRRGSAEARGHR